MSQETPFKIGHVVQLKSGGPKMTVDSTHTLSSTEGSIPRAICRWFDEHGNQCEGQFSMASLKSP